MIIMRLSMLMSFSLAVGNQGATEPSIEHVHSYSISTVGKLCDSPISNEARCRKAAEFLIKDAQEQNSTFLVLQFVMSSDNGHDLPKGCILEMATGDSLPPICNREPCPPIPRFVYWNPKGVAISNDPSFKTICYHPNKTIDGLDCIDDKSIESHGRVSGPDACEVKPNSKPWTVGLVIALLDGEPVFGCGGTLISRNIVLTAAHCICEHTMSISKCVKSVDIENITFEAVVGVIVGDHNRLQIDEGEKFIEKSETIVHEKFITGDPIPNNFNYQYDIAVIVLKDKVVLGDKIKVASLPNEDESCPTGKHLVVSGWGKDVTRPLRSLDKLWAVGVKCLDPSSCPRLNDMNPKTNMICAGDPERLLSSACYGDSGGPMAYTSQDGTTTVYGVVSGPGEDKTTDEETCQTNTLMVRVSEPSLLRWTKATIEKYQ